MKIPPDPLISGFDNGSSCSSSKGTLKALEDLTARVGNPALLRPTKRQRKLASRGALSIQFFFFFWLSCLVLLLFDCV